MGKERGIGLDERIRLRTADLPPLEGMEAGGRAGTALCSQWDLSEKRRRGAVRWRSVELFTGAGGLALGTHLAGFEHAALVEFNHDACKTLRLNALAGAVPGIECWQVAEADVRVVDFRPFAGVDLVAGGPPCQPFSIGGKHRGMEDSRDMMPEFVRTIRELTPQAFMLENVRGLLREGFQTYFSYVLLQLTYPTVVRRSQEGWREHLARLEAVHTRGGAVDLHYNVVSQLLNAADYGVPQVRNRVFVVGFRCDTGIEWHFPEPTHSLEALLHDQWVTGGYWERHGIAPPEDVPQSLAVRGAKIGTYEMFPSMPWRTVRDAIAGLPEPQEGGDTSGVSNHRLNPGARPYVGHTGSQLDLPAKTLKAGDHGVPGGENMIVYPDGSTRYFTVREAARVQTFPDTWVLHGPWSEAMRQLGNAVPVELARVVAESVASALGGTHG